eukprot:GFUD01039790.1.p1 GENE.GFUD01039790.1~~GFUD01039790.1.p1  ORF type:complete len:201 (+),score=55.73 GFUD01039790.1:63-605(+)
MTILWSSMYVLLVAEIGILTSLLLACIPTKLWCDLIAYIDKFIENTTKKIFEHLRVQKLVQTLHITWIYGVKNRVFNINVFFWKYVVSLALVFLVCLRELWITDIIRTEHKYQEVDMMVSLEDNVSLFRAQRNVYISGLTLFLALAIKRLFSLIITLGRVREEREALKYKGFFATTTTKK